MAGLLVQVLLYVALPLLVSPTLQGCEYLLVQKREKSTDGRGWVYVVAALKKDGVTTFDVAFQKLMNQDGSIKAYDIERSMKKSKVEIPQADFQALVDVLDDNGSESVDKEDFEVMWRKFDLWDKALTCFHAKGLDSASEAFAAVDRLKAGVIRAKELYWYLETEPGMTEEMCEKMLSVIGERGKDVGLELNEFKAIFWKKAGAEEAKAGADADAGARAEDGAAAPKGDKDSPDEARQSPQDPEAGTEPGPAPPDEGSSTATATVDAAALLEFPLLFDGPRLQEEQRLARHVTYQY